MKAFLKTGDILIILSVLLLSGLLYLPAVFSESGRKAEILVDGEVVQTVELDRVTEEYVINIRGSEILVRPGGIGYLCSDCPNGDCVRSGILEKTGAAAACLPNRTMIRILSEGSGEEVPDAVTY